MACHLSECGCMNTSGEFPCAEDSAAMAWCQDTYLNGEWCQQSKAYCNNCGGVWCGESDDDLCTPTTSPTSEPTVQPTTAPSYVIPFSPTELGGGSMETIAVSIWLIIGIAVGGFFLIVVFCLWLFCKSCKRSVEVKTRKMYCGVELSASVLVIEVIPAKDTFKSIGSYAESPLGGGPGVPSYTGEAAAENPHANSHFQPIIRMGNEDFVLHETVTHQSVIRNEGVVINRRSALEGEPSIGVPIRYPSHNQERGMFQDTREFKLCSPSHSGQFGEKGLSPPIQRRKLDSPSFSADYPELPSPKWDPTLRSSRFPDLPSPSLLISTSGEAIAMDSNSDLHTEAGPEERVTLGAVGVYNSTLNRLWDRGETETGTEEKFALDQRVQRVAAPRISKDIKISMESKTRMRHSQAEREVFARTSTLEKAWITKVSVD